MMENKELSKSQILKTIFFTTLTVSTTGSSGYAILAGLKKTFVDKYKMINEDDMMTYTSLAQSAPGPMAISGSVIIGYNLAGVAGSIAAVVGTTLPPLTIMVFVYYFYAFIAENETVSKFLMAMGASVSALILSITYDYLKNIVKKKNILYILMIIISFVLMKVFKISTLVILISCALIGIIEALSKKEKKDA